MAMASLRPTAPLAIPRLLGLGAAQPEATLTADEVGAMVGRTGDWIRSRTGIETIHRLSGDETCVDLAVRAARAALADAGTGVDEVDLIIVATCSAPSGGAALAPVVAARLGATAGAFDVNAACAGFTYGLDTAANAVASGCARRVLLIGAEQMSAWIDTGDPKTAILFGDGAGAVVVGTDEAGTGAGIGPTSWGSDGSGAHLIEALPGEHHLRMQGQAVYRWVVATMHTVAQRACAKAGILPEQLDAVVLHQANLRIIEAIVPKIGAINAVVARDIVRSGNTSAASIPIALARLRAEGAVRSGQRVLLAGYGAGLTYAAQVVTVP